MISTVQYPLDKRILTDGAISLYFRETVLRGDIEWFIRAGYRVFEFDAEEWSEQTMHEHLARTLHFPSYYGKNLNAFNDCLGDMQDIDSVGQVLVLRRFDRPVSKFKDHCEGLLDIIAHQSRIWLVEGQRLLCLVQSDDPDLDFGIVGGYRPSWNRSEWSDSERKAPRIES